MIITKKFVTKKFRTWLLAAPLLNAPFTHGEIGVLMRKGQDDLLELVNGVIRRMKADGSLQRLCEKYGLPY